MSQIIHMLLVIVISKVSLKTFFFFCLFENFSQNKNGPQYKIKSKYYATSGFQITPANLAINLLSHLSIIFNFVQIKVVVYFAATQRTSWFKPKKILKIHPEKNSLYFGKWNSLTLPLKNCLNFQKSKASLPSPSPKYKKICIPQKNFLYFRKWNFLALILKKIL